MYTPYIQKSDITHSSHTSTISTTPSKKAGGDFNTNPVEALWEGWQRRRCGKDGKERFGKDGKRFGKDGRERFGKDGRERFGKGWEGGLGKDGRRCGKCRDGSGAEEEEGVWGGGGGVR
ncbi:hypothetical protein Pmani_033030 [Petrolisthes manimaculis]|uniref:Uncharacterized protein n=1 Tax=Petrolisthes manimaculis TaxID=1843537 RepID=A0AAE1NQH4_9EUCA|nr:hypothetical protein Pmani_033030 [Petrolisthes manimaculis]